MEKQQKKMIRNLVSGIYRFSFRFCSRESQSQQKLLKNQFILQYSCFCFIHFKNLNSFSNVKNILLQYSENPYSLYKFFSKYVSVWRQEKHLQCTISRRPRTAFSRHLGSKFMNILVNLSKKIFAPET